MLDNHQVYRYIYLYQGIATQNKGGNPMKETESDPIEDIFFTDPTIQEPRSPMVEFQDLYRFLKALGKTVDEAKEMVMKAVFHRYQINMDPDIHY